MTVNLAGSVAIVTGAAGGIGLATAKVLQARDARVALLDGDAEHLVEAAKQLREAVPSAVYPLDVTDRAAVTDAIRSVTAVLGRPSILINSVGWLGPLNRAVWEYTPEEWQAVFEVNLNGPMNCVRSVLPGMIRAAPAPAHVVNVASMGGMWAERRVGAYGAAKHALVAYTETLEAELKTAAPSIGVSLVCPGAVSTELNRELRESGKARNMPEPSEWRQPEEVAREIVRAIDGGDFYVFTHANTEQRYRAYLDRIFAAFGRIVTS
jgi:NAD(P)-dependent dehydrogenase (short-subunit alcohol dehydrogenase family)